MKEPCKRPLRVLDSMPWKALLVCLLFSTFGSIASAQHASSVRNGQSSRTLPTVQLRAAARVLERISAMTKNGIPDAVLNRTKCLVVVAAINKETSKASGYGVSTCRQAAAEWSAPVFVGFTGYGVAARHADLLVFVLGEKGVQALGSGELEIAAARRAPAPLVKTNRVTPQMERNEELLTYQLSGDVLSGNGVNGVIRRDAEKSNAGAKQIPLQINEYRSSVISFFNTIIPTGIVLHHTAVIPGEKKVPKKESDVDEYHQERGFEIRCAGHVYHVAYHYLIMPNGVVKTGRPERCEGAHATGYNSYLGISVVGDFSSEDNPTGTKGPTKPTGQQISSLIKLCRRIRRRYNIPMKHIVRHSDIANTQCPGDRFPFKSIIDQLQRGSTQ
jgi:lipid-binding SYLF domain-containing protein